MHTTIYILTIATAALNGFGNAVFWPASSIYVSECATDQNKGLFNSIFWIFQMSAFITGNLMAAFVIPNTSE